VLIADRRGEALRELYERHVGWLVLRLMRRCSDREVVDEVVQDTFMGVVPSTLLAAAAGFAFDDSSYETLAASPSSLIRRRLGRLIVVIPPTIILWATLVSQGVNGPQETLTLVAMFAGLVGLTLGIAGVTSLRTGGRGGTVTAPVLLLALIVSAVFSPLWRPLPLGNVPGGWPALQTRWSTAAVIGTLVLLVSSREPARRR